MKKKSSGFARYIELNLGGGSTSAGRFTPARFKPDTELEILRILQRAASDKKIKGIFINTSGFTANREYLWELKTALDNCRAGNKKIAVYFDNADLDLYCMLCAADRIIMDQGGMLNIAGFAWGRFFVKESLEKLGVGFRELRYLDYKSANETFSRTSISDADREQYGEYLDEIFELSKNTVIQKRSIDEKDFNSILKDGIILSPSEAKKRNLADALGREDAVLETIKKMEFGESGKGNIIFITAGNPGFSFFNQGQKAARYAPARAGRFTKTEIAVIHARGNTDLEQGMGARNIARTIRELSEKPKVKAMVVRIDSPGGSAVAADFIAAAIAETKKKIPVVVSMGQTAASGGYWAGMYGSRVTASPYTLTGSIGVIGGWFYDKGLNTKLGIGFESLTRGEHADLMTGIIIPHRDLSDDEEDQFRRCLLDLYAEFVKKAAECRRMKNEDLEKLARGRVYSGLAAQRLGLIDSLGGYLEALETAKKLAEIPSNKKIRIREYPKPKFMESIAARFFASAGMTMPAAFAPGPGFGLAANEMEKFIGDLKYRISNNGKAMPVLPFSLE
ncbi:MAG: signal peptide peptidase SppA [Treponema sp.]|nr:signal peptide peptidase SppA [Treponema sp.]